MIRQITKSVLLTVTMATASCGGSEKDERKSQAGGPNSVVTTGDASTAESSEATTNENSSEVEIDFSAIQGLQFANTAETAKQNKYLSLNFSPSCMAGAIFDLNADGKVERDIDGKLLFALMMDEGNGGGTPASYYTDLMKNGNRSLKQLRTYYKELVSSGILDINGDKKLNAFQDAAAIQGAMEINKTGNKDSLTKFMSSFPKGAMESLLSLMAAKLDCSEPDFPINAYAFEDLKATQTCKRHAAFGALDLNADGKVDWEHDGKILMSLMTLSDKDLDWNALFTKHFKGSSRTNAFRMRRYYTRLMDTGALDIDNSKSLSMFVDSEYAIAYAVAVAKNDQKTIDSILSNKYYKFDKVKLDKLASAKIDCQVSPESALVKDLKIVGTGKFFKDWGGAGNIWVWSKKLNYWVFLTNKGEVRLFDGTSKFPSTGKLLGTVPPYYNVNPDEFVKLAQ